MVKFSRRFAAWGGGGVPAILWIIFAMAAVAGLYLWWSSEGGVAALHVLGKITVIQAPPV